MEKNQIFSTIVNGARRFPSGRYFKLAEAFGPGWSDLDIPSRRQASKEIKIAVAMRKVEGFIFVERDAHRTMIYKRI